eukprot:XP_020395269.1 uncharacterized protein LOC109940245 [Zea mays]
MANPENPFPLGTVIWFGSLEFMSLGYDYDMVLLPPRHHTDDDYRFSQPGGARPLLLPWPEEGHPDLRRRPSRRRRRRRNNRNRTAGGASRPAGASGQADGADSLVRDLSDVSLAPRTTTATHVASTISPSAPPPAIREVGSTSRSLPFGMSNVAAGYPSSVSTHMSAYTELPGHHLQSTLDLLATTPTSEHVDSEVGDDLDPGLDFFGLCDLGSMRHFLSACDYYLSDDSNDYSSDDEGYNPTRECFHAEHEEHGGENQLGMPRIDNTPTPAPRIEGPRERDVVRAPAGSQDAQLEQLHEI